MMHIPLIFFIYKFTSFIGLFLFFTFGYLDLSFFVIGIPIVITFFTLKVIMFYDEKINSSGNAVIKSLAFTIFGFFLIIVSVEESFSFYFNNADEVVFLVIFVTIIIIAIVFENLILRKGVVDNEIVVNGIDYYKLAEAIPGEEVNIEEYLNSDDYYSKHTLLWWVHTKQVNQNVSLRTSEDLYWEVNDSHMYRTNENGVDSMFRIKFCKDDNDLLNHDVNVHGKFFVSHDPRGGEPEEHHEFLEYMYSDGSEIESDVWSEVYDVCNELFSDNNYVDDYDSLDEVSCSSMSIYHISDIVLFKHGNELLDSRSLKEKKNWFSHYCLTHIYEEDEAYCFTYKVDYDDDEEGPYLWWRTKNIPEKSEHVAYQDNRRNSFYVKNGTNLGVCVVHDGKTLSDQRVELRLFFDGYFNIKVKYC